MAGDNRRAQDFAKAAKQARPTRGALLVMMLAAMLVPWRPAWPQPVCEKVVVTADPDYPPLHWYDGQQLRGASIDIAVKLLDDLGVPYEIRYVGPWARVLEMGRMGRVDMITSLKINPERETYLRFLGPSVITNPIALFVRNAQSFAYRGWSDLIGKTGGIARGNIFGGGFDEYMRSMLSTETADTATQNFRKLDAGRIDYVVSGYYTGLATLSDLHMEGRISALSPHVTATENYIALSKASPCLALAEKADARLAQLKETKIFEAITAKALQDWQAQMAAIP